MFGVAAVSLLVVKLRKKKKNQIDGVDQNHLDWMGLIFSCWIVDEFEENTDYRKNDKIILTK